MNEDFYKIIDGLIAQNHLLGQKQIAMECVCSAILAELAQLSTAPAEALDRMNSELCGTAMGVAANVQSLGANPGFDSRAITTTIATIADLSEKYFRRSMRSVSPQNGRKG